VFVSFQHIETPTRQVQNSLPHTLDLILTNEKEMLNSIDILPALVLSDHVHLRFNYFKVISVTVLSTAVPKHAIIYTRQILVGCVNC